MIYPCYKLARKAAEEFGTNHLQNKDDQTMHVNEHKKTVVQTWREPGCPTQLTREFVWSGGCCGH